MYYLHYRKLRTRLSLVVNSERKTVGKKKKERKGTLLLLSCLVDVSQQINALIIISSDENGKFIDKSDITYIH